MKRTPILSAIRRGNLPNPHELTSDDIGTNLELASGFGFVLSSDVGKRVWAKSYGLAMENCHQRDKRKGIRNV